MFFPKIGQVLYIYAENNITGQKTEYKTRLADERGIELLLESPINTETGTTSYLEVDKNIRVEYIVKSGTRYFFESKIKKHVKTNMSFIIIEKPEIEQLKQIQRRNFFRIDIDVELAVQKSDLTRNVFRTEDIGGGGISFLARPRDSFVSGEVVDCWILLPHKNGSIEHANFKAEVVRVKEEERGYKIVMLSYTDIAEIERQRIIRFSFEKQIEFKEKEHK